MSKRLDQKIARDVQRRFKDYPDISYMKLLNEVRKKLGQDGVMNVPLSEVRRKVADEIAAEVQKEVEQQ